MNKITSRLTLLVSICAAVTGCAVSKVDPLTVPLAYKPDSKPVLVGSFSCTAIARVQGFDARGDKTLGVRTHESKPLKADVTLGSDPVPWVQEGVQHILGQNGVVFQGRGPALLVWVNSLRTTESIWHRSSYDAQVSLVAQLQSPSGKICWQGTGTGSAGDYGYPGSIEDYQETLNSALDAAVAQMAGPQGFKDALCQCAN